MSNRIKKNLKKMRLSFKTNFNFKILFNKLLPVFSRRTDKFMLNHTRSINFISRFRLKKLLISSFLILLILPIATVLYFSYAKNKEILVKELSYAVFDTTKTTAQLIGNNFKEIDGIFTEILTDTEFEENIITINKDPFNIKAHNWILQRMRTFRAKAISNGLEAILVTSINGEKHYGELLKSPFYESPFKGSDVEKTLNGSNANKLIFTFEYDGEKYLVFGLKNSNMYIHIYKKISSIKTLYQDVDFKNGEVFIIDNKGEHIISPSIIETSSLINKIGEDKQGYFVNAIKGTDYIISYSQIPNSNYYFISAVSLDSVYKEINSVITTLLWVSAISIIVLLILVYFIATFISAPVFAMQKAMETAEKGILNIEVDINGKSELALLSKSFNKMLKEFIELIKEINKDANILHKHAIEIENSSKSARTISEHTFETYKYLTAAAENQAEEANKSLNIAKELEEKIRNVINYTSVIKDDIYNMVEMINKGHSNMELVVDSSNKTIESHGLVLDSVSLLTNNTNQINKIITMIKNAAEQSNLLALNAAIEAARAGENGKGFAVVAEEMRKLSINIRDSAKDVDEILNDILSNVEKVHKHSQISGEIIREEITLVRKSSEIFKSISNLSKVTIEHISGIDTLMDEMNLSNKMTYDSIMQINEIAEGNAAKTQQLSSTTDEFSDFINDLHNKSQELEKLSSNLLKSVNQFKI